MIATTRLRFDASDPATKFGTYPTAAIAADKDVEAKLVAGADLREKAATAKEEQAKKLHAASEKLLDMKKKAVFRDLALELEGQARADRGFAKERRDAADVVHKMGSAAEASLDKVKKSLSSLRERCGG